MANLALKLFFVSFFINLLYELIHSVLYKTCLEASFKKYVYLILKAAIFDGFIISILYFLSFLIFPGYYFLAFFIFTLLFAWFWEIYSIGKGKWEYSKNMPIVFGVGITPLIQLTLTGFASLYIVILDKVI